MWKKRLTMVLWTLLGVATSTLLIAAMQKKQEKKCAGLRIDINGMHNHEFVNKKDVLDVMKKNGVTKDIVVSTVNLRDIESELEKNAWINEAQLFFDNNQVLHVRIEEREPVARIFTLAGKSYYIDSSCKKLPLSNRLSARVPMFTSFPSDKKILSRPDGMMLQDIKGIAQYVQQDSFLTAQVAQVDITSQRKYEIIPVLGNQVIKLGYADNLNEKFAKLKSFYEQVWTKGDFEKYATIDVQYKGQVVAEKRDPSNVIADTTRAMQQFSNTTQQMKLMLNDTSYAVERVKSSINTKQDSVYSKKLNVTKPATASRHNGTQVKKNMIDKRQPKAVMKKIQE